MNEKEQTYIDGRLVNVENEISNVNDKIEGLETKIDDNLKTQMVQGKEILAHIIDIKEKTAKQNGDIVIALKAAENADEKAIEAKVMAVDAHNRISSITVKILLALVGGLTGGGLVYSVLSKLLP